MNAVAIVTSAVGVPGDVVRVHLTWCINPTDLLVLRCLFDADLLCRSCIADMLSYDAGDQQTVAIVRACGTRGNRVTDGDSVLLFLYDDSVLCCCDIATVAEAVGATHASVEPK